MLDPEEVRDLGWTSYLAEEVIFNARFLNILEWTESGSASVDVRRIGEIERVA